MSKNTRQKVQVSLYRAYTGMNPPTECLNKNKPVAEKFRLSDYLDDDEYDNELLRRNGWSKQRIINYGISADKPLRTIRWREVIDFYSDYQFVFFKGIFPKEWYEKRRPYRKDSEEKRFYNVLIAYTKIKIPAVAGFYDKKFYIPTSFLREKAISKEDFITYFERENFTDYDFSKEGIYFDSQGIHPVMKNDDYNSIKRPGARTPAKKWH